MPPKLSAKKHKLNHKSQPLTSLVQSVHRARFRAAMVTLHRPTHQTFVFQSFGVRKLQKKVSKQGSGAKIVF